MVLFLCPESIDLRDNTLLRYVTFGTDGDERTPEAKETFSVINPATENVICRLPDLNEDATLDAVQAVVKASRVVGSDLSPQDRSDILLAWKALMIENIEDLAKIITSENGKPLTEARAEVHYAANFLGWFAGEALRIEGSVPRPSDRANRVVVIRQPVGPVAVITPWNFPAAMITRKVGAAFAAGCGSVVKPAAETPLTAIAIAELARRAGVPNGALQIITTLKNTVQVGKVLTQHPDICKMSFTGSSSVGKLLATQCTSTMKRVSLELGGNAPFIVFDDADIETATKALIASKFRHSGQTCVCTNRAYVQSGIYDRLLQAVTNEVERFSLGNGMYSSTTHGPLISPAAVKKNEHFVRDAVNKGAKVSVGGRAATSLGSSFFEPTVLANVSPDALCAKEEIFGPILPLIRFDTEDQVIQLANDTKSGLAGYIATGDLARGWRLAEILNVGMVGVNAGSISDVASPFGGVKESGQGREGSVLGIDEYLEA
ncbi:aldehyde dehydrogenase domain-containing protein [Penicillium angulare]|uniref:succinate-semialdehyde dehydrogenase [NAD(P)(+)] n=1 Tax=Penicillium angulare TaxID=116970 RepID=A0A9W9K943_9EURO|nr:aldehyde dehydrogenase domain-containing protein [Penicillium angulare]